MVILSLIVRNILKVEFLIKRLLIKIINKKRKKRKREKNKMKFKLNKR